MEIEHPAAKMMVEIAKTQENEVGDGTTTAVMLAGKLLENAEKLLDMKIHPTVIAKGYTLAAKKAQEILKSLAIEVSDSREDILRYIAMTAMTGKAAETVKEIFADIIVEAVKQVKDNNGIDLTNIKIEKNKSDSVEKTELIRGIVIDKSRVSIDMPVKVQNAKIALISSALEIKNLEKETRISITSPEQLQGFMAQEENMLRDMVQVIKISGANVLFCQKGIDEVVQYYLTKQGIYACRRVAISDMEKLAKATNGKIISNLDELNEKELGHAMLVEEVKHGDEAMTYVRGCENPKALTILVHGGSEHVIDEMERAIRDGLGDVASVIKNKLIVAGAGAIEMELSKKIKEYSNSLSGREQLAVNEFANSLEFIPSTLAENAGLDPIEILTELKSRHEHGEKFAGINIFNNKIEDVLTQGIIEPAKIKQQAISSATEVAVMILRIDDVLASKGGSNNKTIPNYDMGGME